jgi:hypothetical protein
MPESAESPMRQAGEPFDETWDGYIEDLERLLASLARAGWELPDSYSVEYDAEAGAFLFGELVRTGMVIGVQYRPAEGELLLLPCDYDEDFYQLSMLDSEVKISPGDDVDQGADGRVISELFGEGWPEVEQSVRRQLRMWRHFEEDLIGPDAMLRLLTIVGSTSYTRHWWGQGRWAAICRAIITDATSAGVPLPAPYDAEGAVALLRDLRDPEALSDDVLGWMIDIPGTGVDGPYGLRFHESARPIIRKFSLHLMT